MEQQNSRSNSNGPTKYLDKILASPLVDGETGSERDRIRALGQDGVLKAQPHGHEAQPSQSSPKDTTQKQSHEHSQDSGISMSLPDLTSAPTDSDGKSSGLSTSGQDGTARHDLMDGRGSDSHVKQHSQDPALTSPLTHPNGVNIFPNLSTSEQEVISREALQEAEETIYADSDEVSTLAGDNTSDAGYESDVITSASTSVDSSVRDYMYENGRRYHRFREGTYNFPNDDVEQEREDMKHAMVKLLSNQKLHFAPMGQFPQEILDIGTGTGIWAIEMGDRFPSANVLGVDLSPIQPDWLPPNVRFMVDDVESPWLHPGNHFDYIHSRHTVMAIKDWPLLLRRALEHLKPGGWMEMQEIHHIPHSADPSGYISPEHPTAKYWQLIHDGLAALGVNFDAAAGGHLAQMMREAGFVNVTERVFHVPLGTWPRNKVLKTVGLYWRTILTDGLQAIALGPLTRGLGWNSQEVEMLLMEVRRAYSSNSALMYMPMHIIYGQRPEHA